MLVDLAGAIMGDGELEVVDIGSGVQGAGSFLWGAGVSVGGGIVSWKMGLNLLKVPGHGSWGWGRSFQGASPRKVTVLVAAIACPRGFRFNKPIKNM